MIEGYQRRLEAKLRVAERLSELHIDEVLLIDTEAHLARHGFGYFPNQMELKSGYRHFSNAVRAFYNGYPLLVGKTRLHVGIENNGINSILLAYIDDETMQGVPEQERIRTETAMSVVVLLENGIVGCRYLLFLGRTRMNTGKIWQPEENEGFGFLPHPKTAEHALYDIGTLVISPKRNDGHLSLCHIW